MENESIRSEWRDIFGAALPVGFSCREILQDLWLRIHSLPGSKRYAETDLERKEILDRQNAVAEYVLVDGSQCTIFVTSFGKSKVWSPSFAPLNGITPTHVMSHNQDGDDLQFFATNVYWRKGRFDDLISVIADDRSSPVLFANMSRRSVYAPYDGGADLFFSSSEEVAAARQEFSQWMSKREDGF